MLLILVLAFGATMMYHVDKKGHFEIKPWGVCMKDTNVVPIMAMWKYNNMNIINMVRRATKCIRAVSDNIIRVPIGKITLTKCEYIQIRDLMERWNVDIG